MYTFTYYIPSNIKYFGSENEDIVSLWMYKSFWGNSIFLNSLKVPRLDWNPVYCYSFLKLMQKGHYDGKNQKINLKIEKKK